MCIEDFDDPVHNDLYKAIVNKDLKTVESLLAAGIDVNVKLSNGSRVSSLLHHAPNLEITRFLLSRGADVNAMDQSSFTPLHYAIMLQKDLAVVSELVEHGANPNAFSSRGATPLHYAVIDCHFHIIEMLLNVGADMNRQKNLSHESGLRYPTALCVAMEKNIACAKFLVKRNVLLYFENYENIIRLNHLKDSSYVELSHFLKSCVREVEKMRSLMLNNNLSLYEYLLNKSRIPKPLKITADISEEGIIATFPIYQRMIVQKLKLGLERTYLLRRLCIIQVFTSTDGDTGNLQKKVVLNRDCIFLVCAMLSNTDLHNLIKAYDKSFYSYSLISVLEIDKYLIPGFNLIEVI